MLVGAETAKLEIHDDKVRALSRAKKYGM